MMRASSCWIGTMSSLDLTHRTHSLRCWQIASSKCKRLGDSLSLKRMCRLDYGAKSDEESASIRPQPFCTWLLKFDSESEWERQEEEEEEDDIKSDKFITFARQVNSRKLRASLIYGLMSADNVSLVRQPSRLKDLSHLLAPETSGACLRRADESQAKLLDSDWKWLKGGRSWPA